MDEIRKLLGEIFEGVLNGDVGACRDMASLCETLVKSRKREEQELALQHLKLLSAECEKLVVLLTDPQMIMELYGVHRDVLRVYAPYDFESYVLYMEWDREPEKKFYVPRRKQLRPLVKSLQDLHDDVLDILCISLPPGVGKTTLAIFYLTWLAGKYPEEQMLTGSYSGSFVRGVYNECLRLLDKEGEYKWSEVFPNVSIESTNALDCKINIGKGKRFTTLQFTSVGAGNAGQYRATRLLYCDDLVSGIEVALSKDRLDKLWTQYTTDLRQRKQGDHCKELHIATRWSVHDIIGRIESEFEGNKRVRTLVYSAVDDYGRSNFNYDYGVGFTDDFYREQEKMMDEASWLALYMNQPIEREGLLYLRDKLKRYFELPDKEPDAVWSVCDTKNKGSDYCVMPVIFQYGLDCYVEKIICDNRSPDIVDKRLVNTLLEYSVQSGVFESNNAGGRVAKDVQDAVTAAGGITHITTKWNQSNKETRIMVNSGIVKSNFYFKDDSVIENDREYQRALQLLCSWTMTGKNKYDDVPDCFAMAAEQMERKQARKVRVFKRPF